MKLDSAQSIAKFVATAIVPDGERTSNAKAKVAEPTPG